MTRHERYHNVTIHLSYATACLAFILWAWDWVLDASAAPDTFGLRILIALPIALYPTFVQFVTDERLRFLYLSSCLLFMQSIFLHIQSNLNNGFILGQAGWLYWPQVTPMLFLPFNITWVLGLQVVLCFAPIVFASIHKWWITPMIYLYISLSVPSYIISSITIILLWAITDENIKNKVLDISKRYLALDKKHEL